MRMKRTTASHSQMMNGTSITPKSKQGTTTSTNTTKKNENGKKETGVNTKVDHHHGKTMANTIINNHKEQKVTRKTRQVG